MYFSVYSLFSTVLILPSSASSCKLWHYISTYQKKLTIYIIYLWLAMIFDYVQPNDNCKNAKRLLQIQIHQIFSTFAISNPTFLYSIRASLFHSATCKVIGSLLFALICCIPHNKSCLPYPLC